jgi:hypothetical protein
LAMAITIRCTVANYRSITSTDFPFQNTDHTDKLRGSLHW